MLVGLIERENFPIHRFFLSDHILRQFQGKLSIFIEDDPIFGSRKQRNFKIELKLLHRSRQGGLRNI